MAHLSDLKLKYRFLIQSYPFRRVDWRPGTRLRKPLKDARIALMTTAGFYLPGQKPFDQSFRHDDCSFREIPWGTPVETLEIGQSSDAFDHSGIETDRNLALPLDRLRELVEAGVVGEAAPRQFSIMGSLIAPAHCASGLKMALGEIRPPRALIGRLIGSAIKPKVVGNDEHLRRNSPTVGELVIRGERNLDAERVRLCSLIDKFVSGWTSVCTTHPHPFFGSLTPPEWAVLVYKHLDHHLRQFGV